jgi:hypothetical protein
VTVGTVTTLPAGSAATVTNVGTSLAAVLNFGIPQGADGTGTGSGGGDIAAWLARDNEPPSTGWATRDTRGALEVLDFSETTEQAAIFAAVIPQGANFAGGLQIEALWACSTDTVTTRTVGWLIDMQMISPGSIDVDNAEITWGTAKSIPLTTIPSVSGVTKTSSVSFTQIELPAGLAAGRLLRIRIRRDTADDASGDVELYALRATILSPVP